MLQILAENEKIWFDEKFKVAYVKIDSRSIFILAAKNNIRNFSSQKIYIFFQLI